MHLEKETAQKTSMFRFLLFNECFIKGFFTSKTLVRDITTQAKFHGCQ